MLLEGRLNGASLDIGSSLSQEHLVGRGNGLEHRVHYDGRPVVRRR